MSRKSYFESSSGPSYPVVESHVQFTQKAVWSELFLDGQRASLMRY